MDCKSTWELAQDFCDGLVEERSEYFLKHSRFG